MRRLLVLLVALPGVIPVIGQERKLPNMLIPVKSYDEIRPKEEMQSRLESEIARIKGAMRRFDSDTPEYALLQKDLTDLRAELEESIALPKELRNVKKEVWPKLVARIDKIYDPKNAPSPDQVARLLDEQYFDCASLMPECDNEAAIRNINYTYQLALVRSRIMSAASAGDPDTQKIVRDGLLEYARTGAQQGFPTPFYEEDVANTLFFVAGPADSEAMSLIQELYDHCLAWAVDDLGYPESHELTADIRMHQLKIQSEAAEVARMDSEWDSVHPSLSREDLVKIQKEFRKRILILRRRPNLLAAPIAEAYEIAVNEYGDGKLNEWFQKTFLEAVHCIIKKSRDEDQVNDAALGAVNRCLDQYGAYLQEKAATDVCFNLWARGVQRIGDKSSPELKARIGVLRESYSNNPEMARRVKNLDSIGKSVNPN
jgi:hypothetical protein